MLHSPGYRTLLDALLIAGLALAVICDVRARRIPNAVTAPIALAGLALNAAAAGWAGLGDSFGGLLVGIGLLLPVWLAGGMRAGDLKLLGMVGALRGVHFVLGTTLFGALAGGVIALLGLAVRGGTLSVLRNVGAHLTRMVLLQAPVEIEPAAGSFQICYALAIAAGAAVSAWRF